jgi:Xaa-Pro dipeptidase
MPVLVTRSMEAVTIANRVTAAEFMGHSDSETAADAAARILADRSLVGKGIGIEQ